MSLKLPICYCLLGTILAGCSVIPDRSGHVSDADSVELFQKFQRLQPPFDSATAIRVLMDTSWIKHATFYETDAVEGFWPLHTFWGDGGKPTVATLRKAGSLPDCGWTIYIHFRSKIAAQLQKHTESDPIQNRGSHPTTKAKPANFSREMCLQIYK